MTARAIIVTGGDANYYGLISELVQSIEDRREGRDVAIGIIDGGLTADQRRDLVARTDKVVTPDWEFESLRTRAAGRDFLKVNTGKLFLPNYFPGYDIVVFLDGDAWVQDWACIDFLIAGAETGSMAIVSHTSRYHQNDNQVRWLVGPLAEVRTTPVKNARRAGLPASLYRKIGFAPVLNAGAYAIRADAPHWTCMQKWAKRILKRGRPFTVDQLAMSLAVYVDGHPVELLPEWCNYMGPWRFDPETRTLVEYYLPHRPVGLVHMAGQDEMRADPAHAITVHDTAGKAHELSLRYRYWRRDAARRSEGFPSPAVGL